MHSHPTFVISQLLNNVQKARAEKEIDEVESRVKQVETQIRLFLRTPEIENEIKTTFLTKYQVLKSIASGNLTEAQRLYDQMAGQAATCASVGAGKLRANQPATAGWNCVRAGWTTIAGLSAPPCTAD